jgi:rhamnosyltransferase subunit B
MSHMIITAIGSAGDVHPMLGIGAALAARGHRVTFCSHPQFADAARRQGFAFVPVGTAQEYADALANPALWRPRTSLRTLWRVVAPVLRPHFDTLYARTDEDTVLVGTLWAFSARLMQELHRTPFVSVQISPSTLLSAHAPPSHPRLTVPRWLPLALKATLLTLIERRVLDQLIGPQLNAVRAGLGLPRAKRIVGRWLHSTDGVLCLFPGWFAAEQPDWPAPRMLSGFPLFNDVADTPLDAELDAFLTAGEPPVVFTPGSTLVDPDQYFKVVNDTLAATGLRGILLGPGAQGMHDNRLLRRRYVPLAGLLPRCRALVHHGGIGTAALAYAAGVPQVLTPFAHDQFDNAQRVVASGCGVRVDGAVSRDKLVRALTRALGDPAIAASCAERKALLLAAPDGCASAARFIEGFVPTQRAGARSNGASAHAAEASA